MARWDVRETYQIAASIIAEIEAGTFMSRCVGKEKCRLRLSPFGVSQPQLAGHKSDDNRLLPENSGELGDLRERPNLMIAEVFRHLASAYAGTNATRLRQLREIAARSL